MKRKVLFLLLMLMVPKIANADAIGWIGYARVQKLEATIVAVQKTVASMQRTPTPTHSLTPVVKPTREIDRLQGGERSGGDTYGQ